MRDLRTIIRDNEEAMKRYKMGLPLHYLHETKGSIFHDRSERLVDDGSTHRPNATAVG